MKKGRLSKDEKSQIVTLNKEGKSVQQIANQLDRSATVISKFVDGNIETETKNNQVDDFFATLSNEQKIKILSMLANEDASLEESTIDGAAALGVKGANKLVRNKTLECLTLDDSELDDQTFQKIKMPPKIGTPKRKSSVYVAKCTYCEKQDRITDRNKTYLTERKEWVYICNDCLLERKG